MAQVYARGVALNWTQFATPYRHRKVPLPTYPFQRERYWVDIRSEADRAPFRTSTGESSLLGRRVDSPALDGAIFVSEMGPNTAAGFALEHRVFGTPILPGTAYLAVAVDAASRVLDSQAVVLRDVEFREALALPEKGTREVQLIARRESAGELRVEIFSRSDAASPWTLHFAARALSEGASSAAAEAVSRNADSELCPESIGTDEFYSQLEARGLEFGPLFRGVGALSRGARDAMGEASLPEPLQSEASRYRIHPVLLDACVQVLAAVSRPSDPQGLFLPVQIATCRIEQGSAPLINCRAHATLRAGSEPNAQVMIADVDVRDSAGAVVARLEGVQLQRASREALDRLRSVDLADSLVELRWDAEQPTATAWARPVALADAVRPDIAKLSAQTGWDQWNEVGPQLDRVCRAYIGNALRSLGWKAQPGSRADTASLASAARHQARLHSAARQVPRHPRARRRGATAQRWLARNRHVREYERRQAARNPRESLPGVRR